MEKIEKEESNKFGLLGRNISYSFSKSYFAKKFESLGLNHHSYENFDIDKIDDIQNIIHKSSVKGLNVTIPYKLEVIPFLSELSKEAKEIGAVNTIKFTKDKITGYNTDCYGFQKSLEPLLRSRHRKALILGTGGASKAIAYVFNLLHIEYQFVSRTFGDNQISYEMLDNKIMEEYLILVNCTPLGTYPNVDEKPHIPYDLITSDHLLYDLIYNPSKTAFLLAGEKKGATIQNGLRMLELQAEKSWEIWNS